MGAPSDIKIADYPEEHLSAIAKWRSDSKVNRYLRVGYRSIEEVRQWYQSYFGSAENCLFGIWVGERLVGYCSIEGLDRSNRKCELGVVVGEPGRWRKGIGSSAILLLVKVAFTELGMHRVEALIQGDNVSSMRCFSRAGFHLDGRLRDAKCREGRFIDMLVYSILSEEWGSTDP